MQAIGLFVKYHFPLRAEQLKAQVVVDLNEQRMHTSVCQWLFVGCSVLLLELRPGAHSWSSLHPNCPHSDSKHTQGTCSLMTTQAESCMLSSPGMSYALPNLVGALSRLGLLGEVGGHKGVAQGSIRVDALLGVQCHAAVQQVRQCCHLQQARVGPQQTSHSGEDAATSACCLLLWCHGTRLQNPLQAAPGCAASCRNSPHNHAHSLASVRQRHCNTLLTAGAAVVVSAPSATSHNNQASCWLNHHQQHCFSSTSARSHPWASICP